MKTKTPLTKHALQRLQQRAIPESMLSLLFAYGDYQRAGGGCVKVALTRKGAKRLRRDLQTLLGQFDSLRNTYLVESPDGAVITVGHQH